MQEAETNVLVQFSEGEPLFETRNLLLRRSKGDYVYYVDADDWLPSRQALPKLLETVVDDFAWGDFEAYLTPLDKYIHVSQSTMTKLACGSWLARRESFEFDPWEPDPLEPHRSNWTMPEEWVGAYVEFPIFQYRVAWSSSQLTNNIVDQ